MSVLFVANFGSNTGYAWDTIEAVIRRVGERLQATGRHAAVCYPSLEAGYPRPLEGSPVEVLRFDYGTTSGWAGMAAFLRLLRSAGVEVLYLTDMPTWSWKYPLFRMAGVRRIVVHDRTSGDRHPRHPRLQGWKRLVHRIPGVGGDVFVGVSDFVAQRLVRVNGTPPERTVRVHNGIDLDRFPAPARGALHALLGLPAATRVVFCSGRAQPYKGIPVLLEAAALLRADGVGDVAFAYCGDGPALDDFRRDAAARGLDHVHFLGKRSDVPRLIGSATVAVVPSVWAEAFGLSVVEAMAAGVPVVATRTGGIPELVDDGRTGVVVPPGDARALADAIRALLDSESLRARMADEARAVARARFGIEHAVEALTRVVRGALEGRRTPGAPPAAHPARAP